MPNTLSLVLDAFGLVSLTVGVMMAITGGPGVKTKVAKLEVGLVYIKESLDRLLALFNGQQSEQRARQKDRKND